MRSLPWQNCKNWTPFCSGEKIFNFSTRDPDHLHALASRAYGAIFSKNRFFGTTHRDKPTSQNGISLRSPSLIMAPAKTNVHSTQLSGIASTSRMGTAISNRTVAANDSCFHLIRPHQHDIAVGHFSYPKAALWPPFTAEANAKT